MEQVRDYGTWDVLRRFVRRRWRTPVRMAGVGLGAIALCGASFFTPRAKQDGTIRYVAEAGAEASGVVESLRQKGVGATFDGLVKSVEVAQGQAVKKGQVLFRLDTSGLETALGAAKTDAHNSRLVLKQTLAQRDAELAGVNQEIAAIKSEMGKAARPVQQPTGEYTLLESGELQPVTVETAAVVDTSGLQGRLQELQAFRAQRLQDWEPAIQSARQAVVASDGEVKRLAAQIAGATRRAPMAGVVTSLRVRAGEWAPGNTPVVRIDDPSSYRVVTMVDQNAKQSLAPGQRLELVSAEGTLTGKVEKLEQGWDQELFYYYVWVKPAQAKGLDPGEKVGVQLPSQMVALK